MENNEVENSDKVSFRASLQDYLSFGYLYLLTLGIIHEVIFYKMIGINILNYSSIVDVILSPISFLVKDIRIPSVIAGLVVVAMTMKIVLTKLSNKQEEKQKKLGKPPKKKNAFTKFFSKNFISITTAIGIFSMYFGAGVGGGERIAQRIKNQDYTLEHRLHFADKETVDVFLVGQNTEYIFYVAEGSTTVTISPIQGNIKRIEQLELD